MFPVKTANVSSAGYYFFDGNVWRSMQSSGTSGTGWSLNGNGGIVTSPEILDATPSSQNFLGTLNASNLVFVTNNKVHGVLNDIGVFMGGGNTGSSFSWGYNNSFQDNAGFTNTSKFSLGMTNHVIGSGVTPTLAIGYRNTSANNSMIFGEGGNATNMGYIYMEVIVKQVMV